MAAAAVFPTMQTVQIDGLVQYSARAHFYEPGTTTPKTVYTTAALDVAHPNPLPVNGVGRFPPIYLGPGNFRVQIKTDAGTLLEDYDDLPGGPEDPPVIPPFPPAGTVIPTGFEMVAELDTPVDGWVRANGRTISKAGGGGTELASDACYALFKQRWNKLPGLPVTGGRGVSADADWLAGKAVPLPDARGRAFVGRASMGASAANTITVDTASFPDQSGHHFGDQRIGLEAAHNGPHEHVATTSSEGAHQHAGSSTDVQGNHTHPYSYATYAPEAVTTAGGPGRQTLIMVDVVTGGAGAHGHNVNLISDGLHDHDVTVQSSGTGTPHNNVQPSRMVTVFVKL